MELLHAPNTGIQQNTIPHCARHAAGPVSTQQHTYICHLVFSYSSQLREERMLETLP